jgi:demethylspheroidene O-methyltransferase
VALARRELSLQPRADWSDRWLAWRDRLLSSPLFRRRASAFMLTRPVARRRARELFDLVAGFVYSQVLLACVQLRVFDILAERPQTPGQLAARLALPIDSTQRLLAAAVSLRLLERRSEGRYGLGELGAAMVGNTAVAAMVEHHAALYADLADPVALLRAPADAARKNALAGYWPYAAAPSPGGLSSDRVSAYSALMSASQPLVSAEILDAYRLGAHRCLLDVGGGDGTFLTAVATRAPKLGLMLFDLPAVAQQARERFAAAGLQERAQAIGGSFLTDALPRGADIASLVRVIHDHDDAGAMTILRAVRQALPPDGSLLLAEPMSGTAGAEAMGDAYFGFYLLAMGSGRPRTAAELTRMLNEAGFEAVRRLSTRMPLQTQLLMARCADPRRADMSRKP